MLRRYSSKSRPDIKQRKSTSPTRPSGIRLEHINVEHAQRDAHTAATEAFARSQQRNNVDTPLFPPPAPLQRSTSVRTGLKRQQSVRFVADGSARGNNRSSGGGDEDGGTLEKKENMRPHGEMGDRIHDEEASALGSRSSLNVGGLRRSKSMASGLASLATSRPARTSGITNPNLDRGQACSDSPPDSFSPGSNESGSKPKPAHHNLRAPKSMSFLRSHRRENSQADSFTSRATGQRDAVERTESVYSQRTTISGRLKAAPSMLFRSGSMRSVGSGRKSMRSSMRGSVHGSMPSAISGGSRVGSYQSTDSSLAGKARKVSHTFKAKIKTLFGRGNKGAGVVDELTAAEDQKGLDCCEDGSVHGHDDGGSAQEEGTLTRVSSLRVPSIRVQDHTARSRKGSIDSVQSECQANASDEASRATSWASSDHSTVASQQQAWSDLQQQRLSVITENTMGMLPQVGPPRPQGETTSEKTGGGESIKDKRVYSALARRLAERQKLAEAAKANGTEAPATRRERDDVQSGDAVSRVYLGLVENAAHQTIRCVTASTETLADPDVGATAGPKAVGLLQTANRWNASVSSLETTASEGRAHLSEARRCSTPELPSLGLPRADRSSAFFGSPSCHLFRTASPYRRAIRESMKADEMASNVPRPQPSPLSRPLGELEPPRSDICLRLSAVDGNVDYSSSTYSGDDENNDDSRVSRRVLGTSSESVDWKTWLAANASKLEVQPLPAHETGRVPEVTSSSRGHQREATEIYTDDERTGEDSCYTRHVAATSIMEAVTPDAQREVAAPQGVGRGEVRRAPSHHGPQSTLVENQAPRTPTRSGNQAHSKGRPLTCRAAEEENNGSPYRQQSATSVKLVRRAGIDGKSSPERGVLSERTRQAEAGVGSKRMVEVFLSSRRRRMESSKDAEVDDASV